MENNSLTVTPSGHIQMLLPLLLMIGIGVAIGIYAEDFDAAFFTSLTILIPFGIPVAYIHYSYYTVDRDRKVTVTPAGISLGYNNGTETFYPVTDIQTISIFSNNVIMSIPWCSYSYAEIKLSNGDSLLITSLLCSNLVELCKDNFPDELITVRGGVFDVFIPREQLPF
ncbi:hypothetical protein VF13_41865 [Nostoc linckia z16]|nr:hypothetical protein VF12_41000 [Nostoc linckia z15]PHK27180.1 hypothetical protein VF13_41865 [Nostoc linckia z16]